jgi:hypothetical protein
MILAALAGAVLSGCATSPANSPAQVDMQEAVLRHLFQEAPDVAEVYFIEVGGNDPSPDLLRRFQGHIPPVRPGSRANVSGRGVKARKTGRRGVLFWVGGRFEKRPVPVGNRVAYRDGRLVVETGEASWIGGGLFVNGLWAREWRLSLVRRNGKWVVALADLLIVS